MNEREDLGPGDDGILEHLVAFDEALAAGQRPTPPVDPDPDKADVLQKGQDCVLLLEQLWPRRKGNGPETSVTIGFTQGTAETSTDVSIPRQLGRFEVVRELGRGGCGTVFLANDPVLKRAVALKVPHLQNVLTSEHQQRFLQEAQAAARLDHPNIVSVFESGVDGMICYVASAYCPGMDLRQWTKRRSEPMSVRESARLVAELAAAMHHAHQQGVLHRDLKPSNVLVVSATDEEESFLVPRITDFGLAKIVEEADSEAPQTRSGAVLGTPQYMAPEQAKGNPDEIDCRADVYGLGAILYELLTGNPPFQGSSVYEVLSKVEKSEPISPRRIRAEVPRDLETICLKCLEKDPQKRYATAADLGDDLKRYLDGRSITARRVGPLERVSKWARRRPEFAGLALVCVLALIGLVVGSSIYWVQTTEHDKTIRASMTRRSELNEKLEREQQEHLRKQHLIRARTYVGHINQAVVQQEKTGLNRMWDALRKCEPAPGEGDLRGFEWHYLMRHSLQYGRPSRLRGHGERVVQVALAPGGKRLASISRNGILKIWDTFTGQCQWTLEGGKRTNQDVMVWSRDAKLLAWTHAERDDRVVLVLEVDTQKIYRRQSPSYITGLAFVPGQAKILVSEHNVREGSVGRLLSWEWPSDEERVLRTERSGSLTLMGLSPDGRYTVVHSQKQGGPLLVGYGDGSTWKTPTPEHPSRFISFVPLRSGDWGLVDHCQDSEEYRVCSMRTGQRFVEFQIPVPRSRRKMWLTDSFQRVFGFDEDSSAIREWDLVTGNRLRVHPLRHPWAFTVDAFDPTSGLLALPDASRFVDLIRLGEVRGHELLLGPEKGGEGWAVAYSPDGSILAAGYDDEAGRDRETLKLWDARTGKVHANCPGHKGTVMALGFAPDGKTLATASYDRTVKLWNIPAGTLRTTLLGHTGPVRALAWAPDGQTLATGGSDGAIRVWSVATGKTLRILPGHSGRVRCLAFARDGERLVSGGNDRYIRFWDLRADTLTATTAFEKNVLAIRFDPAGKHLLVSTEKGSTWVVDATTKEKLQTVGDPVDWIRALAFSPDGRTLATGSHDGRVRLWQADTWAELMTLPTTDRQINSLAFSPDNETLAAACHDGRVLLWRTAADVPVERTSATSLSEARLHELQGQHLSARGEEKEALLRWVRALQKAEPDQVELKQRVRQQLSRVYHRPQLQRTQNQYREGYFADLTFSPDGKHYLSAGATTRDFAQLFDAATGKPVGEPTVHRDSLRRAIFSPDGKQVLTTTWQNGEERLWEVPTGKPIGEPFRRPGRKGLAAVAFRPDGKVFATGSALYDLDETDWKTREQTHLGFKVPNTLGPSSLAFSPDGKRLFLGHDNRSSCWDLATRTMLTDRMPHQGWAREVRYSPDGKAVAVASDNEVKLWDARSFELQRTLPHPNHVVFDLCFSPADGTLATASGDKTLRLWDSQTGQLLGKPVPHPDEVRCVAFHPNGRTLLTGCADGKLRVWHVPPPLRGDLERITAQVELFCGSKLNEQGDRVPLTEEEKQQRRR